MSGPLHRPNNHVGTENLKAWESLGKLGNHACVGFAQIQDCRRQMMLTPKDVAILQGKLATMLIHTGFDEHPS
jgi:hypothetical protein